MDFNKIQTYEKMGSFFLMSITTQISLNKNLSGMEVLYEPLKHIAMETKPGEVRRMIAKTDQRNTSPDAWRKNFKGQQLGSNSSVRKLLLIYKGGSYRWKRKIQLAKDYHDSVLNNTSKPHCLLRRLTRTVFSFQKIRAQTVTHLT